MGCDIHIYTEILYQKYMDSNTVYTYPPTHQQHMHTQTHARTTSCPPCSSWCRHIGLVLAQPALMLDALRQQGRVAALQELEDWAAGQPGVVRALAGLIRRSGGDAEVRLLPPSTA